MKRMILPLLLILLMTACSVQPQPISYGEEACSFCRMTIMDKNFGAEIVTTKGKVIKFDALECMMNYLHKQQIKQSDIHQLLVVDAAQPGILQPVENCGYMMSEKLPSPMGSNISAFCNKAALAEAVANFKGEQLDWKAVQKKYSEN